MTSPATSPAPPGWYPDPAGERQWRVWTGRDWSVVTRSYDPEQPSAPIAESLGLVTATQRLVRYGVATVFAGLGLVVSVADHWPGTAHPINATLATTLLTVAVALIVLGTAGYAFAGRELAGRWSPILVVPGVNVIVVSSMISRRLGEVGPLRRAAANVALLALYVLESRNYPYLALLPALVSLDLMTSLTRMRSQLLGATGTARRAS